MNKNELMGKRVKFWKRIYRKRKRDFPGVISDTYELDIEQQCGWITGFRTLPKVKIEYEDGYPMPISLKGSVQCVLISRTPYENPLRVPMDAFEVVE